MNYTILIASIALLGFCTQCKTAKPTNTDTNPTANAKPINTTIINSKAGSVTKLLALDGKWEFQYFTTITTDKKILFPSAVPILNIELKRNKFSSMAGCNTVNGSMSVGANNSINFIQPFTSTRMACNAMGEGKYLDILAQLKYYSLQEDMLFLSVDTKPAMVFKRVKQ